MGEKVGTLFNVQAADEFATQNRGNPAKFAAVPEDEECNGSEGGPAAASGPEAMARAARAQSRVLASLTSAERSAILMRIADALEAREADIMTANAIDVANATGHIEGNMLQRLVIKPGKLEQLAAGVRQLANMDEPIGKLLNKTEIAEVRAPTFVYLCLLASACTCLVCVYACV